MPNIDNQAIRPIFVGAIELAKQMNHKYVVAEHILVVCFNNPAIQDFLNTKYSHINAQDLMEAITRHINDPRYNEINQHPNRDPILTDTAEVIYQRTISMAAQSGRMISREMDVLISIIHEEETWASMVMQHFGFNEIQLKRDISDYIDTHQTTDNRNGNARESNTEKVLKEFCVNLNEKASEGKIDPLIGRSKEVYQTIKALARRSKNNVIYVGEAGVGKTAIAEGLAKLINEDAVPEIIKGSTVYALEVSNIVAGTKYRGDFEERFKNILAALAAKEKSILFIDEIHQAMGAGSAGTSNVDVANMLKPFLARGEIRVIGSTTDAEYRSHFEKDRALIRRFQKIIVAEPSIEDSIAILQGIRPYYEEFHGVKYTDEAIETAVRLTAKHMMGKFLPDKAIDVIDGIGAFQRITDPDNRIEVITEKEIEAEVASLTSIPPTTFEESDIDV
ncbi:MAG: AAA family ATPase, partial [Candidimonas sp.]